MTPTTIKKITLWAAPLLVVFVLAEGMAFSATAVNPDSKQAVNNVLSAPMPSGTNPAATGPPVRLPAPGISSATTGSQPTAPSCPLSLSTGPKGDIRDIRGPIHIPDPRLWFFYVLGGILLLLLAWAGWKWFGKRQSYHVKKAFEIAFEELEKAKALMTPEMAEKFSVMVSKAIRTYIESRFRMRATRKTTREFMSQVTAEPAGELNLHSEPLREFLDHCYLAKFSRKTFSREQMKKMHRSAWQFVDKTRPQPVAAGGR